MTSRYVGYRSPRDSGVHQAATSYKGFSDCISESMDRLGPCILPGGRGQPQIVIGEKYTKLKTIKGEWPFIRTGVISLYKEWAIEYINANPDKFNPSVIAYQCERNHVGSSRKGKYRASGGSVVYFIGAEGLDYIKIGKAEDVYKRLDGIQTSMPFDLKILLTIPGDVTEERKAHEVFNKWRKRGEWFIKCKAITDYIEYMSDDKNIFLTPSEYADRYGY